MIFLKQHIASYSSVVKSKLLVLIGLVLLNATGSITNIYGQKQVIPEKPVLVVQIVVDQMRADYISRFWNNFSDGGFKKLVQGGTTYNHATYPYQFTQEAADYASLSTGTPPCKHGINSFFYYDRKTNTLNSTIKDDESLQIGSKVGVSGHSARNLLASTLGDELKKSSYGKSKVFAVSMHKEAAILLAGHSANGVLWMDDESGKWVTSNYYINWLPQWVEKENDAKKPDGYMLQKWDLLKAKNNYVNQPEGVNNNILDRFPVEFGRFKYNGAPYRILKSTPFANMLVSDMAIKLIQEEKLGLDDTPDLLYLNFANVSSLKMVSGPYSLRTEDMMLRIDLEIEKLLTYLDKTYGTQKYMVVLSSTQGAADMPETLKAYNLPNGIFQPQRTIALLNSYLMALYGQGQWITAYNNLQFYLNQDLIEKSSFGKDQVMKDAATFLEEFTGIAYAYSSDALKNAHGGQSGQFKKVQNVYYPGKSGDILLTLEPGWIELGNDETHPGVACNSNIRVPMLFYGWKVAREKINTKVTPLDIATTLSDVFGITIPNEANGDILKITRFPY